ncbi:hypothetical protein E2C01_097386 [Portunus trituberculatus]|uniref:Uncharacterized protein n=1 Tax=Portunus trituberculatus TaxID=210409 RepID=A0A5B7JY64_PORTR|nr:hypothetical protein [Portunus trituberculatus]
MHVTTTKASLLRHRHAGAVTQTVTYSVAVPETHA